MGIVLNQFNESVVTPKDDALLYDQLIGENGIFEGCTITHLGGNQLQIAAGRGIIRGRIFVVTQETILATVSDSGTKLGRLIIEVDIENITTPIAFITQMGTTLPALMQEDINRDGTVYQLPLSMYSISETTITNLVSVAEAISEIKPHEHGVADVDGLTEALNAKLPSASYTAPDVLAKFKTVDGAGSGADADLLDGQHASAFALGSGALTASKVLVSDANGRVAASAIASADLHPIIYSGTQPAGAADGTVWLEPID